VFDDTFWEGLDLVVNALDNVNARLYVDSRWGGQGTLHQLAPCHTPCPAMQ
jgi:hypothetical protein